MELSELDSIANLRNEYNIFTIQQIQERCLTAFDLSNVEGQVRKFSMENDPDLESVDEIKGGKIRLTTKERNHYSINHSKHKIILLLGAGASVFINKPTTIQFKEILIKKYKNYVKNKSDSEDIINLKILMGLLKFETFEDIEYLFQFFDDLSEVDLFKILKTPNIAEKYLERRLQLYIDDESIRYHEFLKFLKNVPTLSEILENEVYIHYRLSGEIAEGELLKKVYLDNLLPFLRKFNDDRLIITTTNYDKIIEEVVELDNNTYNLVDGFENVGHKIKFDNKNFDNYDMQKLNITLLKLHGSLDWKLNKKDEIVMKTEEKTDLPSIKKHLLIKPTLFIKESKEEPFLSIHNRFNEFLQNYEIFLVIGFSFRDKYLVDYIKKEFVNKMIILIDPNPFDVLRNFLDIKEKKDLKYLKIHGNDVFSYFHNNFKIVLIQHFFDLKTINKITQNLEFVIASNDDKGFWHITKLPNPPESFK